MSMTTSAALLSRHPSNLLEHIAAMRPSVLCINRSHIQHIPDGESMSWDGLLAGARLFRASSVV